jgi:hypothetical protein
MESRMSKFVWVPVVVLALLPYVAAWVLYPYLRLSGWMTAVSLLILFLPPSLMFGVILSFLASGHRERYSPRTLVRVLFALDVVFYFLLLYRVFLYL